MNLYLLHIEIVSTDGSKDMIYTAIRAVNSQEALEVACAMVKELVEPYWGVAQIKIDYLGED